MIVDWCELDLDRSTLCRSADFPTFDGLIFCLRYGMLKAWDPIRNRFLSKCM